MQVEPTYQTDNTAVDHDGWRSKQEPPASYCHFVEIRKQFRLTPNTEKRTEKQS